MSPGFALDATDATGARAGVLRTRHGDVPTPAFMTVATYGAFRHLGLEEAHAAGARVLLCNTYHLMVRPGPDVFRALGGIHAWLRWDGPVLTDSGGFQIFSLPGERLVTEKGAHFRARDDNQRHLLTPERSVIIQQAIGSDIAMVLDLCIDSTTDEQGTRAAMERTHRWAVRSLAAHRDGPGGQALFGIVQGGVHPGLRRESAAFLVAHPFDGFAIGGLAVGETKPEREEMTACATASLPADRPRYLMGVGTPLDLVEAVGRGVDLFDCILPTKMAQQGQAYTFDGVVRLSRPEHRMSERPIEEGCTCAVCRRYSRAYVQHLAHGKHHAGARLLAIHNVHHYHALMARLRQAIVEGTFDAVRARLRDTLGARRA